MGPPTRKGHRLGGWVRRGLGPRGRKGNGSEGSGLSARRAKVVRPTPGPAIEGAHRPPAARATEAGDNGGRAGARGGQRAQREASTAAAVRCCFGAVWCLPGRPCGPCGGRRLAPTTAISPTLDAASTLMMERPGPRSRGPEPTRPRVRAWRSRRRGDDGAGDGAGRPTAHPRRRRRWHRWLPLRRPHTGRRRRAPTWRPTRATVHRSRAWRRRR